MSEWVLIDTNVFIYGFEFPESNSARIVSMINERLIKPVITERILIEVKRYFGRFHGKRLADRFRYYLLQVCKMVDSEDIVAEMRLLKGKMKDKDLQQIAAARKLGIRLISYDKDFKGFEEYVTPKEFVASFGLKVSREHY